MHGGGREGFWGEGTGLMSSLFILVSFSCHLGTASTEMGLSDQPTGCATV